MVKTFVFNFKLDADDRRRLIALAHQLQRTQADTVRWLIRNAPQLDYMRPQSLDWDKYSIYAPGEEDGGYDE